MENKHPKVFISYAWTSDEYVVKVHKFVTSLRQNGVDTLFDKHDLKPGQSLTSFMEKSVLDPSIDKVLILLNKEYKLKADNKKGGVGAETQIISPEVYSKTNNTKFIPIIFDYESDNPLDIIPIYLRDRCFINLADDENYADQYNVLLRTIYNKEIYKKVELGPTPNFDDEKGSEEKIILSKIYSLNKNKSSLETSNNIVEFCFDKLKQVYDKFKETSIDANNFLEIYKTFELPRNIFLKSLTNVSASKLFDHIYEYLTNIVKYRSNHDFKNKLLCLYTHELVIEIVAILYKKSMYKDLYDLLTTTYFDEYDKPCKFGELFYSMQHTELYNLGIFINEKNKTNWLTPIGNIWLSNIPIELLDKNDFANADQLISNILYIYGKDNWFALTYVYVDNKNSWIRQISSYIVSKRQCEKYLPLFGCENINELKIKMENMKSIVESNKGWHGYGNVFAEIDFITKDLDIKKIGSLN